MKDKLIEKLRDLLEPVGTIFLYIFVGIAAIAIVCGAIIGVMALVNYVDSPVLYGIIAFVVIGWCLIGFPIYLYRSRHTGAFISVLCVYVILIILALSKCSG